ncbi:MAG: hypothetical protein KBI01_03290 [Oscillospiraceae bacterium]|nr:hypothetical protein [Oscillospiraceae bacterium]
MKKRNLALICIVALLASLLAGCGKEVVVTPKPAPTQAQTETATPAPVPTQQAADYPLEKEFVVQIEGIDENVTMQLYDLSVNDWGNLEAGIYIDTSMYDVAFIEGGYVIVPTGSGEVSTFMEIRYFSDMTEDDLAARIFELYTSDLVTEDLGENYTENGKARVVSGQTADGTSWGAYIFPVAAGGCVTMVLCLPPEALEGHGARLMASAATFFEK